MCLAFTVLFAFALGFLVKTRLPAVNLYLALYSIVFSVQTLNLLMDWMAGSDEAFGSVPTRFPTDYSSSDVIAYAVVNGAIVLVGTGLVVAGARTATKRAAKANSVSVA